LWRLGQEDLCSLGVSLLLGAILEEGSHGVAGFVALCFPMNGDGRGWVACMGRRFKIGNALRDTVGVSKAFGGSNAV
jgi:hypothetical protein